MAKTYEPITTNTLGSASANVVFTSISSAYTDLVVVVSAIHSNVGTDLRLRLNSDTASNYSETQLRAYTSSTSNRTSNATYLQFTNNVGGSTTEPSATIIHLLNYSNTNTDKTVLIRHNQFQSTYYETVAQIGLYRSSSAISTITLFPGNGNFSSGSTFTIFGILKA
jgi:hypothetical protein